MRLPRAPLRLAVFEREAVKEETLYYTIHNKLERKDKGVTNNVVGFFSFFIFKVVGGDLIYGFCLNIICQNKLLSAIMNNKYL